MGAIIYHSFLLLAFNEEWLRYEDEVVLFYGATVKSSVSG
jgi:hypothetical protein